ncbi:MAG: amidase [Nocardioides sp.]|nr:amidase [Nocardioides sp.]
MPTSPARRHVAGLLAASLAAAACVGTLAAPRASAITTVATDNGASFNVNDARRPGLDTGSIRNISNSRMEAFGSLFVQVDGGGAEPRMNGQMVRGFGLTAGPAGSFHSTRSVLLGGVAMSRQLQVDDATSVATFLDSFTNTTTEPLSLDVSFGGSLGYGLADNTRGAVVASSSGDATADGDDTWIVTNTTGNYRSQAVVVGDVDGLGDQQADPFETAYSTTGSRANDIGFVHALALEPGETASLLSYVHSGARGDTTDAQVVAADLASAPLLDELTLDEICTVANFDVSSYDAACVGADPLALPPAEATAPGTTDVAYDVTGKTIAELQADMTAGVVTSVQVTQAYLDRIAAYDGGAYGFHAFITVADTALAQARAADEARASGVTGSLLGVPLGIKDIYDTVDMPTTGGTRALEDWNTGADSWQVAKLREAGAVIIGKTNLSEFANSGSFSESGYMQTWNGLYPSKTSFGSSGGSATAVAADLAAGAMGTQTGVSLYAPSTGAGLTTFRGTDGLTSTDGVMPLTWATDYAGPMAKTVTDVAALLDATATQSTGNNPDDLLTSRVDNTLRPAEWTTGLTTDALEGKVLGYRPSSFQSTSIADDEAGPTVLAQTVAALESAGATVVALPDGAAAAPTAPPSSQYPTSGSAGAEGWERYQAVDRPAAFPYTTKELMESPANLPYNVSGNYTAQPMDDTSVENLLARRDAYKVNADEWMDSAFGQPVDAVLYPGFLTSMGNNDASSAIMSADRASGVITQSVGLPTVILPVGLNPEGQTNNVQIVGRAWDDADVLAMGYALEQVVDAHVHTEYAPALEWTGPAESVTTLDLAATSTSYADPVEAVVTVAADPAATGRVTVEVDGRTVAGRLSGGTATVVLPARTSVGTHLVTATYDGSSTVAPSAATAVLRVTRAVPTLSARPTATTYGPKARPRLKVSVSTGAPGAVQVVVYDRTKVVTSAVVGQRPNRTVRLPRLATGKHVLRVRVVATEEYRSVTSRKMVVRVRP